MISATGSESWTVTADFDVSTAASPSTCGGFLLDRFVLFAYFFDTGGSFRACFGLRTTLAGYRSRFFYFNGKRDKPQAISEGEESEFVRVVTCTVTARSLGQTLFLIETVLDSLFRGG